MGVPGAEERVCVGHQAGHGHLGFLWKGKCWPCRNQQSGFGEMTGPAVQPGGKDRQ